MVVCLGIAAILLVSCGPGHTDRADAIGRYINDYEEGAEQYVDLLADSTFRHYYTGRYGSHTNVGTWQLDSAGREVSFDRWLNLGDLNGDSTCFNKGCYQSVQLYYGELRFNYDRSEVNFFKD